MALLDSLAAGWERARFVLAYLLPSLGIHVLLMAWVGARDVTAEPVSAEPNVVELVPFPSPPVELEVAARVVADTEPDSSRPAVEQKSPSRRRAAESQVAASSVAVEDVGAPLPLSGIRLSNADVAMGAASGRATSSVTTRSEEIREAPRRSTPTLVALDDLSRKPAAPSLDARLRDNYPRDLERQGIEGEALVRLTLSERGFVVDATALSHTHLAFANACRRTLLGSRWSLALDREGKPARTQLTYRCRFQVAF